MRLASRRDQVGGFPRVAGAVIVSAAVLVLSACDAPKPPAVAPPPEVGVIAVQPKSTPLSLDIVGEIRALREIELRPRVGGLVEKQLFTPGQMVRAGQPLFIIDTRALDLSVADAQARLVEAQAQLTRAEQDVARYEPLLVDDAIPRQTYDAAVAAAKQAGSVVQSRQEAIARARLDRSFAEVRAPIDGQIGLQQIEVGGLATAGQSVLAVVSSLDPVAVYFSVSENEYLAFTRKLKAAAERRRTPDRPVQLLLADGSLYPQAGHFDFADRAVNTKTGTLSLRAVFPNPDALIRPGMTGRVRVTYDVVDQAIVIPQKAVTELLGKHFVLVVGADGKVEQRPIVVGERIGADWLVESGLRPGDTIVVEGVQKARAGAVVKPMPLGASSPAAVPAPAAAATSAKK